MNCRSSMHNKAVCSHVLHETQRTDQCEFICREVNRKTATWKGTHFTLDQYHCIANGTYL